MPTRKNTGPRVKLRRVGALERLEKTVCPISFETVYLYPTRNKDELTDDEKKLVKKLVKKLEKNWHKRVEKEVEILKARIGF